MPNWKRCSGGPSTKSVKDQTAATTRVKPVGGPADRFLDAIAERRSVYALTRKSSIPNERVVEIVQHAVLHTPTSFNSQSNRAVVLFGENHMRLWGIVAKSLKKILPPEQFEGTVGKVRSFQAGYLTILYFIDTKVVKELEEQYKTYAENFVPWAQQSSGMLQSNVWVALEKEGLGASLQHYSNLIEVEVKKVYNIPQEWSLISQQPVGVPAEGWKAPEKDFKPLEETVKVFH
ncbi:uncharacterized protein EI90DRAFT_3031359 [Cantharellus anzutake]|uniref:uncharacterized protein n=1 Tax=Cantharellus anzutake TaxID=1750568 RepID=UPI0019075CAF|nr:uncharacterized protein EI90DRAFT_3031359 [Cantharellus anzutake]KAF8343101.1 hypothetical protein EI90DRAFT_3031359 [Cantharellus anzutake]